MTKKQIYWLCQIGGWSLYAAINIFFLMMVTQDTKASQILSYILEAMFFMLSTHFYRELMIRWGWLKIRFPRLLPKVILSLVFLSIINYGFQIAISQGLGMLDPERDFQFVAILLPLLKAFILYSVWSLIYLMFHYVENYNQNLRYEAGMREVELNNLKSQLNPHFIFNALNSIRALVDENPGKSKNAITQLSNILRTSLVLDKNRLSRFNDEIKTVRDYLELESIRFEERLKFELEIAPGSDQYDIPPLMIQTLVENGIKHGISTLKEGGKIKIQTSVKNEILTIQIRNSGQFVNGTAIMNRGGYGLPNTRKRLRLIYGDEASFNIRNENDEIVLTELKIPQI